MTSRSSGTAGEDVTAQLLAYEGWAITRQVMLDGGHRVDMVGRHIDYPDTIFEVKVWGSRTSGTDTVKKAIGDAYDLRELAEERPYVLVLSHHLGQMHRDMLARALKAGVISEVRILGFREFQP